jgi:hypothetical protein
MGRIRQVGLALLIIPSLLGLVLFSAASMRQGEGRAAEVTLTPEVYLPFAFFDPTSTPAPVIHLSGRVTRADGSGFEGVEVGS